MDSAVVDVARVPGLISNNNLKWPILDRVVATHGNPSKAITVRWRWRQVDELTRARNTVPKDAPCARRKVLYTSVDAKARPPHPSR